MRLSDLAFVDDACEQDDVSPIWTSASANVHFNTAAL
jgi:hypothetical protein